jgi:hypothetical protein
VMVTLPKMVKFLGNGLLLAEDFGA